jgi:2-oxoglutarate dehydrogenase E2 component (dihydrolipoamide succinyltransferase)
VIVEVKVPPLAESIAEATLVRWQKRPGEVVRRGDSLIEIETDKVVLEVAAPEGGVLTELLKQDGESVLSEQVIATIDTDYGERDRTEQPAPPQVVPRGPAPAAPQALSPAVRRLVAEHHVNAAEVPGSGRGGRITKGDVLAHLERPPAAPPAAGAPAAARPAPPAPPQAPAAPARVPGERREPMSRLRARIAERLLEAQHSAAILTTFNEINMQPVMDLRSRHRERFEKVHGTRLGFMSFFARASALALQRFPLVNAFIDGRDVVYHDYYHIGIAVGSPRGLVVPVLRDVDRLSFAEIERRIAEFGTRAQDGKLSPEDLLGGTFTITNGGVFGSLLSTPILNPPQSAILGMHKIQDRPVVENGQMVVRPMMYVALSYDHRLIDGREAVQFLVAVKDALEDPARMLLQI